MSRNIEFHNQLGLSYGPAAPSWDRSQESLVKGALGSWDGDPVNMSIHIENVKSMSPAGNAQTHDQAQAMLNELWDSPQQHTRTLYRGSRPDEKPGIKSYSENPNTAKRFAKKYGGGVVKIKAPVGLQMSKYVPAYDPREKQWIVDETDPRNQR